MLRVPKDHLGVAVLLAAWVALLLWSVTRIRYTVDGRHLRVRLGRLTLRKIALSDIESVDTRWCFWNEHWCNTFWPRGRIVRIRRRSGLFRNFVITPADRDKVLHKLQERLYAIRGGR
jgi:hypothetical protein